MDFQVWLKYPVIFTAGFVTVYFLTPFIRRCAGRLGMVDLPDERRIHQLPTPRGGGLAIFLGFHAACAVLFLLPWSPFLGQLNINWWWRFAIISSWLVIVGLVDDARGLKPVVKLLGQIIAAGAAYALDIRVGNALGIQLSPILDFAGTVIWILVFINAFNLIDGIDGLAAGLAVIATIGIAGGLIFRHVPADVLVCLGFSGACLAFLRYNFHPASIFLGDTGSMFVGLTLACIALSTASKGAALASIAVPFLAIGVPIFDVMLAIWRRMVGRLFAGGESRHRVMGADMEHLHHRLIRSGMSQKVVATWLYGLAATLVFLALAGMVYKDQAVGIFLVAFAAGAFVIVKHLARVELWNSGVAILNGLRRPSGKVMAVLSYPVIDVLILAGALWISLWLAYPERGIMDLKNQWIDYIPIWVGAPFVALIVGQAYRRVWSRARLSEIVELELALVMGVLACIGLSMILYKDSGRLLLLLALLFAGITITGIVTTRIFLRVLQDVLVLAARHPMLAGKRDLHNTLIYGAGNRCTLFLRRRSCDYPLPDDQRRIVGLLDDDPNLRGRLVYGYKVLGSGDDLSTIVKKHQVREIILAADLESGTRARFLRTAGRLGLAVCEWNFAEMKLL